MDATKAQKIIDYGKKYLGKPYVYGAKRGIDTAFDCSSFTQWCFGKFGTKLNATSATQSTQGTAVPLASIQKGDLIFFATGTNAKQVTHVAIYMGGNQILHTYQKPTGVTTSAFASGGYWRSHALFARRFV